MQTNADHATPTSISGLICYINNDALDERYLFPDHDVILVVAVVCIPQFTCEKTSNSMAIKMFGFFFHSITIST